MAPPGVTLRPWRRDDLAAMVDIVNARIDVEGEGEHMTVASAAEHYDHLRNCDPATDLVVAVDGDDEVLGFARTAWFDVAEGHRDYHVMFEGAAGVAAAMLDWAVARASEVAATHDHPDRRLATWAVEGSERERLIQAAGFDAVGWSAFMVRPHLRDIPPAPLPDGLQIRPVERDHWRRIWEADVTAFRDGRGFVEQTEEDWQRFVAEAEQGTDLWRVAWAGADVVGQVRTRFHDDEIARLGRRRAWTEDISTRRDWRGRGVATALIVASLHQLADAGFEEAALTVDLDNPTGALRVYERLGYVLTRRAVQYQRRIVS